MGLLEQIQDLKFAIDMAQKSALEFVAVLVENEPVVDRITQKMEKLKMDSAAFLATVKQIDDATTAVGESVSAVSARITELAKEISDNANGNVAVDAAVSKLAQDATTLAAAATALKAMASDPANPVPDPQNSQTA